MLLASGAAISISQLKPGDKVVATNVKTGKTSPETVKAVILEHDNDLAVAFQLSTVSSPARATRQLVVSSVSAPEGALVSSAGLVEGRVRLSGC